MFVWLGMSGEDFVGEKSCLCMCVLLFMCLLWVFRFLEICVWEEGVGVLVDCDECVVVGMCCWNVFYCDVYCENDVFWICEFFFGEEWKWMWGGVVM